MYFEDIPFYTIFSEVREKVAEIVLSASDSAEFLGSSGYGLQEIYDLYGTKYEDIIPAFRSFKSGESYGMYGKLFRFELSDHLRRHIAEEGLDCVFGENGKLFLENLYLFSENKIIFSCLSHEVLSLYHMAEIDDSLSDCIQSGINETITNMPLYDNMLQISRQLKGKTESAIKRELSILSDLCWYVDREKRVWAYSPPKRECNFADFKKIAKSYLTKDTYSALSDINSYSELQPLPVAKTVEDVLNGIGKDTPQFICSSYYNTVKRELNMLKYVMNIKK